MAQDPTSPQNSKSKPARVRPEGRSSLLHDTLGSTSGPQPLPSPLRRFQGVVEQAIGHAAETADHHSGGRDANENLWKAAREGNSQNLEKALKIGADFNYSVEADDLNEDAPLVYKNRKVKAQAIHAAALFPTSSKEMHDEERAWLEENYEEVYDKKALACVKLLVEHRADPRTKAEIYDDGVTRELEVIHMAAGAGNAKTVEYLIQKSADVNAQATMRSSAGRKLHYYPIHDAVWFNRKESVKVLLRNRAEIDEKWKNNDGNTALHLAARMGHDDLVRYLLYDQFRDEDEEKDEEEETFSAKPVDAKAARAEAKKRDFKWNSDMKKSCTLVRIPNLDHEVALTLAVEKGHFPADQLYLFTHCLNFLEREQAMKGRVHAFLKVATTCPDAAPKLVRTYPRNTKDGTYGAVHKIDLKNTEISQEWKESIIAGAEFTDKDTNQKLITVDHLCNLIDQAPAAAVDLLDMLTTAPKEENKQHNPLPVRANIPYDQEACRLSCVYIEDKNWTWKDKNSKSKDVKQEVKVNMAPMLPGFVTNYFDQLAAKKSAKDKMANLPWQEKLAPQDAKRSQEVKVKMLMLPGVMNSRLVHCLAATRDHKIFTKLVVHALLKYLWKSFRPMFLVDLAHQFLSTVVLSYWILIAGQVETPRMIRCGLWGILAAEGISECFMFIWTCVICHSNLGRRLLYRHVKREYYRFIMGGLALALAIETSPEFQPAENSSILLSINSLVHWITMLFEIRAFRATGKRILPIMKSVLPIVGMLVIMLFISLAFMHAFWAMDRAGINEISVFNIVVLLFTGEQFLTPEDLLEMPQSKRTSMILLCIGGVFIFLTCTINVFIAVLSDCYDHEQERMVCTFLKERARICSSYFFRPKMKASGFSFIQKGVMKLKWWRWWFLLVLIPGIYIAILWGITESAFLTLWVSAIFPAAAVLCIQCILKDMAVANWKINYLWFCHEVDVEEESLAPEQRDEEDSNGRISRMKKYIKSEIKGCDQNVQDLSTKVEALHEKTTSDLAWVRQFLFEVSHKLQLLFEVGIFPPDSDLPSPDMRGFEDWKKRRQASKGRQQEPHPKSPGRQQEPHPKEGMPSPSGIPSPSLCRTIRLPTEPPTDTFEAAIPSQPPTPKAGGDVGAAMNDLAGLKQEVTFIGDSLQELRSMVEDQREEQEKLAVTCQDIQSLLGRVVELAEARHRKKGTSRGAASGPEGPSETADFGRGNDVPAAVPTGTME